MLKGKKILIGVTGGIAIYKVCEIIRLLKKEEAEVKVIMTEHAKKFINPMVFEVLSENKVYTSLFDNMDGGAIHIELSKWADILIIAPATANIIGKISHGVADDLLTTLVLAFDKKIILVPSMHKNMWLNKIVSKNVDFLKSKGFLILEPEVGELLSKDIGPGRFPEVKDIVTFTKREILKKHPWDKVKALVTAGPTREYIDEVRFISNRSSGKMGYKMAEALYERGADVILISGPTWITPPYGVKIKKIETSNELLETMLSYIEEVNLVIMTAAVCDFKPKYKVNKKLRKGELSYLEIAQTEDIIKRIKEKYPEKFIIGFAAEFGEDVDEARRKLKEKNLDVIILNDISKKDIGFESDKNKVKIIFKSGKIVSTEILEKKKLSEVILNEIEPLIAEIF